MTQVTLPISSHEFTPDFPEMLPRKLNWMGRIIQWIRLTRDQSWFHHSLLITIGIIISTTLLCSIILSPLFVYGFREWICQEERAIYDKKFAKLVSIATDGNRVHFLRGRLDPLSKVSMPLTSSIRRQITKDLELTASDVKEKSDKELLLAAALKFDNFIERYHLDIRSTSRWAILRMLGY